MTYVPATMSITPLMIENIRQARKTRTITELSVICGVNQKILYHILNGKQERVNMKLGAKILKLTQIIQAMDAGKPFSSTEPVKQVMEYEQFHRQCNTPEFVAALRACCTNYRDIELKIKDIRENMK